MTKRKKKSDIRFIKHTHNSGLCTKKHPNFSTKTRTVNTF